MTPTLQAPAEAASGESSDAADVPEPFPYAAPVESDGALLERPTEDGSCAADGAACPDCGGATVNGAGLVACPDCEWTGRLASIPRVHSK